jgi:predicted Ser/Thr protein kinase
VVSERKETTTTRKRVGPFTVSGVIGEGGMGTVLRCHRKGEEVAVKMIRPNLLGSDDIRARFAREAELLKSVDDPNVAKIVGFDAKNKTSPWLATEYIDGPNLKEWVAEHGAMGEASWEELAVGVFSGLAAIHERGILHRDIKPANIMMSPEGPKIIDFGISKEEGQTALTNTQMFAGTVAYLAPERVDANEESQASDMFSAGLVLAVAARGEHPWGDETTQTELAILRNMATEEPRLDGLTERQQKILRALLRRYPESRPDARSALAILRGEAEDLGVEEGTGPSKLRHFNASVTGAVLRGSVVAALAVLATTVIGLIQSSGRGNDLLANGIMRASGALSNALRVDPVQSDFSWILSSEANLATSLGIRPTLITFGLMAIMVFFGKRYASHLAQMATKDRIIRLVALSLPTLAVVVGLSWLVPGGVGMMPWDVLFGGIILAFALGLGLVVGGLSHDHSPATWWLQATRTFLFLVLGVGVAVLVGGVIHGVLSPDLAVSTANRGAGPLAGYTLVDFVALAIATALILPTMLVVAIDALVTGQGHLALRGNDFLYLQALGQPADDNNLLTFTPQAAILSGLFLALVALAAIIAGSHSAGTRNVTVAGKRWLIQLAMLTVVAMLLLFALLRVSVDSSATLRGSFFIQSSIPTTLLLLGLTAASALVIAFLFWCGGHREVAPRIASFFPGVPSPPSTQLVVAEEKPRVSLKHAPAFAVIAAVAIITLVIPTGLGFVERQWATTNTPEKLVSELALAMEIRDGQALTELMPLAPGTRWLPVAALEAAQPIVGQKRDVSITNDQGRTWRVGELDATGKVTWPVTEGTITWTVPLDSVVDERFIFGRQAKYFPALLPITLSLSVDESLGKIDGAPIRINGVEVAPAQYSLIPGEYTIERDPFDLLSGFFERLVVTASSHAIEVPAELDLPSDGERAIFTAAVDAAESCGNVRRSKCFSEDDINTAQRIVSGSIPSAFFARESTAFEDGGLRCEEGTIEMLSTREIVRELVCTQIVRYETKYWDSRQIAEPVYSTRCASWWYSFWFGLSCLRWERYQSGTNYRTVRGDLIDTVRYQSDMPIRVAVPAGLNDANEFVIGDAVITP